jgi:alpha-D-xyloside xylohydrolase
LARPLVYDYPSDPATHPIDDQYMLGPDFLVAPMFKPRGSRNIYLPAGGWYDFWTDRRLEGARWITYDAELETLPLFVRAGAVLPMGPDLQYANERSWDPLTFEIYLDDTGGTELEISDDRRRLRLTLTVNGQTVLLEGGPLDYAAEVRVHRSGGPPLAGQLGQPVALIR